MSYVLSVDSRNRVYSIRRTIIRRCKTVCEGGVEVINGFDYWFIIGILSIRGLVNLHRRFRNAMHKNLVNNLSDKMIDLRRLLSATDSLVSAISCLVIALTCLVSA